MSGDGKRGITCSKGGSRVVGSSNAQVQQYKHRYRKYAGRQAAGRGPARDRRQPVTKIKFLLGLSRSVAMGQNGCCWESNAVGANVARASTACWHSGATRPAAARLQTAAASFADTTLEADSTGCGSGTRRIGCCASAQRSFIPQPFIWKGSSTSPSPCDCCVATCVAASSAKMDCRGGAAGHAASHDDGGRATCPQSAAGGSSLGSLAARQAGRACKQHP